MPSDLAATVVATRQKIEANGDRFAGLLTAAEGAGQDITERLDQFRATMRPVGADSADVLVGASRLLSAFRTDLAGDVDDLADSTDGTVQEIVDRLEAVIHAAESFDQEVTHGLANLFDQLDDGMQATGEAIESLKDEIADTFSDRLESAKDMLSTELEDLLNTERTELLDEIEEALSEAIAELSETAESLGERTRDEIAELWGILARRTEERFMVVLQDSVDQIAQQVVQETAQQVVEDIGLTQLSAQVTMSLQSQLPTLTAAKYSVDAVKSLLDAF